MANLWAIITGLTVLVEKRGDERDPAVVLLRRVDDNTKVVGVKIPPHEPQLRVSGVAEDIPIGERDVSFSGPQNQAPQVLNRGLLLPVGRELDDPLTVRPELLGPRADMGQDSALLSRVKLSGGVVRPIHIDMNFDLRQISVNTNVLLSYALDLAANGRPIPKNNRRIANGLLFQLHIPDGEPVVMSVGDQRIESQPIAAGNAGNLPIKDEEDNHVVWIVNTGLDHPADEEFDRDFFLLYDLLAGGAAARHVPGTILQRAIDTGEGNPPGQCMNGYALA